MQNLMSSIMLFDEALASTVLSDRISVPTQRTLTDSGQMLVPCKFARTGSQRYLAKQVFTDAAMLKQEGLEPDDIIELHRDEHTVFDEESMSTFRSAPVTIGHPKDAEGNPIAVTAENAKELQVGVLEGMPVRDEDTLGGTLVLTSQEAIDALNSGIQELSAGYKCDIEKIDGKYYQRRVRANHIAIVPKGRAGASCRISDEALEVTINDDHIQPVPWDFQNDESYKVAYKSWLLAEYLEHYGTKDADGKAAGNTGVLDEATIKLVADSGLTVDEGISTEALVKLLTDELATSKQEVLTKDGLVNDFKQQAEEETIKSKQLEVELADAKLAATEGVLERSTTIEQARLIADMRIEDLSDKSTSEIKKLVVQDQNPEKDYDGKSEAFIDAMFEILVDSVKGDTPMGKLLRSQSSHVIVDAKPVDPVAAARDKMIARQKQSSK